MIARPLLTLLLVASLPQFFIAVCSASPTTPATNAAQVQVTARQQPEVGYKLLVPCKDPLTPEVFELPAGAVARWRDFAAQKPALLLFSSHPLLAPLDEGDRKVARQLVSKGTFTEIVRRGKNTAADTAFVSPQTVSVAIDSGLIGELVYVLPTAQTRPRCHP